jgi:hypothetical protein
MAWILSFPKIPSGADSRDEYPVEVINRAADIFRMAGHMLAMKHGYATDNNREADFISGPSSRQRRHYGEAFRRRAIRHPCRSTARQSL